MQFHVLSFEGPDAYSRVGGIATRVEGRLVGNRLTPTQAIGERGFPTAAQHDIDLIAGDPVARLAAPGDQ